ncbi:MAG: glucose-1-phosphate adenylyltransferase family protein, partial [Candidatus Coproplasma sp.]
FGGVHILSPYEAKKDTSWYKGTANAIYQNIRFMKMYDPEYVLILSGDHIYKMDYDKMLAAHKEAGADCTIACMKVPMKEASRFGILNTNPDGTIYEFEEKPKQPKSDLASMGIYIFTASKLFKYLELDEQDPNSEKDFGKNVLPAMLNAGEKMLSYRFEGYWKDVGTISSLLEANMDLLGEVPNFDLRDSERVIHSRSPLAPPAYVEGTVVNSMIANGCEVEGEVINSVVGTNCVIEKGAVVKDSVLMGNIVVKSGASVNYSIIDEEVTIGKDAKVGDVREVASKVEGKTSGITVLGRGIVVSDGAGVPAGEIVDKNV